jgi:RNA polymerase sigma-70 factor (ECF subfamily)
VSDDDAAFWGSLVRRIQQGEREAETELARQFYVRVRPMASVQLRWSDAAVDIAQETIVQALEALRAGRLREPEKLPAFVLGIARNLINNHKRKEAQSREILERPPDRPVEADPALARLDEQQRALVRTALVRLSPVDRRILLLTLIEDRTPREIAPMVGLTPEVVRTRKSRAIKALADEIEAVTRMPRPNHVP